MIPCRVLLTSKTSKNITLKKIHVVRGHKFSKISLKSHGTRCAGAAAANANNSVCGVGIAYDAEIGGIRILDGPITDLLEARALSYKAGHVHIRSASCNILKKYSILKRVLIFFFYLFK